MNKVTLKRGLTELEKRERRRAALKKVGVQGQPVALNDVLEDMTLLDWFKVYLGIELGDSTQDEALERALDIGTDLVEDYLDREVVKREMEDIHDYHPGTVELNQWPVDTAMAVTVDVDGTTSTDYTVWLKQGRIGTLSRTGSPRRSPPDWQNFSQVLVNYTAGYDPLPNTLALGIIYTAGEYRKTEGTSSTPNESTDQVKSLNLVDVGTVTYAQATQTSQSNVDYRAGNGGVPDDAAVILSKYARWTV